MTTSDELSSATIICCKFYTCPYDFSYMFVALTTQILATETTRDVGLRGPSKSTVAKECVLIALKVRAI